MENAGKFREKLDQGQVCLGAVITGADATLTEALGGLVDFFWIDTEHNAIPLDVAQAHLMAAKAIATPALVRVPWNDPVLIKPVLDIGADGVIVPLVRSVADVERAVAACKYPPEGVRGFGPRRASGYGRLGGPDFCRTANETILIMVQIEHIEAAQNIDAILAVPGLTGIVMGPNDLAGSMGYMGQPEHPEVLRVMEHVITQTRRTKLYAGMSAGGGPEVQVAWAKRGVQWMSVGNDMSFLLAGARQMTGGIRALLSPAGETR